MPRKNPLPNVEIAICERVREARELLGISRVLFAQRAGIDSSVLSNVEHCKIALRYGLAKRLMRTFGINPNWLAAGIEPLVHHIPEQLNLDELADDSERFSVVYDDGPLRHRVSTSEQSMLRTWAGVGFVTTVPPEDPRHISKMPVEEKDRLLGVLARELDRLHKSELANWALAFRAELNPNSLADGARNDTNAPVPVSLLESLIAKAKAATARRGQRSELARCLEVPRQRVAQWFSGVSAPNAEDALRLSEWVRKAAAEPKKEPSGAEPPKGKTTRNSKSKLDEKTKSDRPKK